MKSFKTFVAESSSPITKREKSLVGDNGTRYDLDGGHIDIQHKNLPYAPRSQSVVSFHVPDEKQGKGIGTKLLHHAMVMHEDIGAQCSSPASVKIFHNCGFRNPNLGRDATFEDHEKQRKSDSSVFMARNDNKGKPFFNFGV